MIISDFPVMMDMSDKFPEFEYTGEYTIIDDGSESGMKQVAFLTTGTLTLPDGAEGVTVQAQGGGGSGGAYNGTSKGSDGYDGSIDSYEGNLAAGTYIVTIGAGGDGPYNAKGKSGGTTSFGDILSAGGGTGGAYGDNVKRTHSGLYSTYGWGGAGGTSSNKSYNVDTGVTRYYGLDGSPGVVILSGKA